MASVAREPILLAKRSDLVSALVVAAHVAFALVPVYVGCALGVGWWLAPLTLWFGAGMNSMLNLTHECSHYHVFTSKRACTTLGRWILGPMALTDFESFRQRHWEHHRRLGTDADPKYVYHTPIRGWGLSILLLKCLVLFEPARRYAMSFRGAGGEDGDSEPLDKRWIGRAILFHAALTASLAGIALAAPHDKETAGVILDAALVYGIVYLYGLATITVFIASLRGIAEHQIGADGAPHQENAALRNFRVNPITRWLFGAYGFADHYTHHLRPAIPYYRLPQATRELAAIDGALAPKSTYLRTLRMLVSAGKKPQIEVHGLSEPA